MAGTHCTFAEQYDPIRYTSFSETINIETARYVCEEISPHDLEQEQVNTILTAVVQGMTAAQESPDVRLAAVRSLYNALSFAETNFENEMERNYIMKVVLWAAVSTELQIRQSSI
ncbi:hypothetical protein HPP92_011695 [Vanilla planifolia]|uniref:Uncharacterized protein n=1 Tax=Vanilla planifolia TaxID=51239 RepID=A0A835R879_VANPL|nr:hypothetical protein HPP92_012025 [Vanilla planifolia]KAG0483611.1 hypothetical protein HPP92_011695 [Vanilla planifolia]